MIHLGSAPMDMMNIDTDKIIPKLHLRMIKRTGRGVVMVRSFNLPTPTSPML